MSAITSGLQPLVYNQYRELYASVTVTQFTFPDPATALVLIGLGLLLGVLLCAAIASDE
jgi:hypothetical protein